MIVAVNAAVDLTVTAVVETAAAEADTAEAMIEAEAVNEAEAIAEIVHAVLAAVIAQAAANLEASSPFSFSRNGSIGAVSPFPSLCFIPHIGSGK